MHEVLGGHAVWAWTLFNLLILGLLALDLFVLNRRAHEVSFREAVVWNVVWTAVGLSFAAAIPFLYQEASSEMALQYLTGYVIERALSIDNIFVFLVVFRYFAVPPIYQRGVLYWGILGALVMRAVLILAGAALVARFHWVLYLFGAFLVYSGIALLLKRDEDPHPERNPVVRLARRFLPVLPTLEGGKFFARRDGRLMATPLFLVLLVVETTDLVFALDSIPAIFAVTQDPFIIYTSNVFAILGLRAMYFLLAALLPKFIYLKHGLSAVLVLVGARMLLEHWVDFPTAAMLLTVTAVLGGSILASIASSRRLR